MDINLEITLDESTTNLIEDFERKVLQCCIIEYGSDRVAIGKAMGISGRTVMTKVDTFELRDIWYRYKTKEGKK